MDRDTLRFLTRSYRFLQGLRIVPMGALLVGWNMITPLWPKSNLRDSVQLALVVGALAAWILIGRYYEDRFGIVTQRGSAAVSAFGIIAWCAAWLITAKIDEAGPPVSATSLLISGFFALGAAQSRGHRWYALAPAGAFAILGLFPAVRVVSAAVVADRFIPITFGAALVFTGLLDHLLLVRHLAEPSDV